jgi:xanthine dehydrogenase accessory factor
MDIYHRMTGLLDQGQPFVLATLIARKGPGARQAGSKMIITETGESFGSLGGGMLDAEVIRRAEKLHGHDDATLFELEPEKFADGDICGSRVQVFLETVIPGAAMVVVGAGHVGRAVTAIGRQAGFHVRLLDDRPREETGTDHIRARADAFFSSVQVLPAMPIIICTRSHSLDYTVLCQALQTSASFIGLLGSRRKRENFFNRLRREGIVGSELQRIVTPVGLDIGARTPQEIAVSIVAQLIAVNREPQH